MVKSSFLFVFLLCCLSVKAFTGHQLPFSLSNPLGVNPRVQARAFMFPAQAQLIVDAANEANAYTDQFFGAGAQNQNDNSSNAFRHSVWNALAVKKLKDAGANEATATDIVQRFTSAYEYNDAGTALVKTAASAMDLNNNLVAWFDAQFSLEFDKLLSQILDDNNVQFTTSNDESSSTAELNAMSFEKYNQQIDKIKHHLNRGDCYELNYCIPLLLKTKISPVSIQKKLKNNSPAPLTAFYKYQHNWLISASPERFIKKNGDKLISQPIKGTARRNGNSLEDEKVKKELLTSEKERAENIMITDLVRNDLSKVAARNSVHVNELCGLYSFAQVFQLISTISCQLRPQVDFIQIITALFPMGSMTGAPKFRSMEIIDELEDFQRGLFSGSVGYISPEGDFDFNVVIRSIFYNEKKEEILIAAGSAITLKSNAEDEYNECLLKANAMLKVLGLDVTSLNVIK